jgi:hypothetical protein
MYVCIYVCVCVCAQYTSVLCVCVYVCTVHLCVCARLCMLLLPLRVCLWMMGWGRDVRTLLPSLNTSTCSHVVRSGAAATAAAAGSRPRTSIRTSLDDQYERTPGRQLASLSLSPYVCVNK